MRFGSPIAAADGDVVEGRADPRLAVLGTSKLAPFAVLVAFFVVMMVAVSGPLPATSSPDDPGFAQGPKIP